MNGLRLQLLQEVDHAIVLVITGLVFGAGMCLFVSRQKVSIRLMGLWAALLALIAGTTL